MKRTHATAFGMDVDATGPVNLARTQVLRRKSSKRMSRGKPGLSRGLTMVQKRQVQGIIDAQTEVKYFGTATLGQTATVTSQVFDLSAVPQGDTDTTRDGDRIHIKKMHVRGQVLIADATQLFRVIFFQWFPLTTPVGGDILLNGPTGAIDVYSHYNHDSRQQFAILRDDFYSMLGNAAAATNPYTTASQQVFSFTLKPREKNLQFAAGGTTGTNHIWYLIISDSNLAAHPTITMGTKLMFTDM